jgi:hypothetical protein
MTKFAIFTVKHRSSPKLAVIVAYNPETGRQGKVLASEPIADSFSNDDLAAAATRLAPQATGYELILPIGVELKQA